MAKSKKPNWDSKAEAEWNDVEPAKGGSTPNMKSLIADVRNAVAAKQSTKKMSKKQRKLMLAAKVLAAKREKDHDTLVTAAEKAITEALSDTDAEEQEDAIKAQLGISAALNDLRMEITKAFGTLDLVNEVTRARIMDRQRKVLALIKAAPVGVDRKAVLEELHSTDDDIKLLMDMIDKNVRKHNDPALKGWMYKAAAFFGKANQSRDFVGPSNPSQFTRGVNRGREFMGDDAYGKGRMIGGATRRGMNAVGRGAGAAYDVLRHPGPMVAKSLKALTKATQNTGTAIKDVTKSTFKWLGKRMSSMAGMLSRFLRAPFRGSGNALSSLIGMGALFGALIKPMIAGIDQELKSRFGDKYIEDFISGLWSKSWGYLVGQIKSFLGISTDAEKAALADKAQTKSNEAAAAYNANPNYDTKFARDLASAEAARRKVNAVPTGASSNTVINAKLEAYRGLTNQSDKNRARMELQNYIEDEKTPIPQSMADTLKKEGFRVPSYRIGVDTPSPVTVTPATTGSSSSAGGGRGTYGVSAPVTSSAGGGRGTVGVSAPVSSPMESGSAPPVTAKPNSSAPESGSPVSKGASRSGGGSASGASQIPTYAASESFTVLSLGVA